MQVFVFKTKEEAAKAAVSVFAAELMKKPNAIFGLATGSSPIPLYHEMIKLNKEGAMDFSKCRSWNLDEYVGLKPDHVCSYRRFMNEELFDHVNIDKANTHMPSGIAADMAKEAADYDAAIEAAGGIDIQLLGIGRNGHIGFNEPAKEFTYGTHVVTLAEDTIQANARFFKSPDDVPRQAISMGIGNIMAAKCVVLVATGKDKAEAVYKTIRGPITPEVPASILQLHPCCVILTDMEAAALMKD